jgi:hypothetical protein
MCAFLTGINDFDSMIYLTRCEQYLPAFKVAIDIYANAKSGCPNQHSYGLKI